MTKKSRQNFKSRFFMIIFTQNMKTKKLNKKHIKIVKTQHSLKTFAYDKG